MKASIYHFGEPVETVKSFSKGLLDAGIYNVIRERNWQKCKLQIGKRQAAVKQYELNKSSRHSRGQISLDDSRQSASRSQRRISHSVVISTNLLSLNLFSIISFLIRPTIGRSVARCTRQPWRDCVWHLLRLHARLVFITGALIGSLAFGTGIAVTTDLLNRKQIK